LSQDKANYVLREIHEGICRNYSKKRALAHKALRAGYYWPTIAQDAHNMVKKLQKMSALCQCPKKSIEKPHINIIGPLPLGKGGVKFAVVAIDYFTKWAKGQALATIIEKNIKHFMWRFVVYRFGILHSIVSNNGK
jgi:hypothetical protein